MFNAYSWKRDGKYIKKNKARGRESAREGGEGKGISRSFISYHALDKDALTLINEKPRTVLATCRFHVRQPGSPHPQPE